MRHLIMQMKRGIFEELTAVANLGSEFNHGSGRLNLHRDLLFNNIIFCNFC